MKEQRKEELVKEYTTFVGNNYRNEKLVTTKGVAEWWVSKVEHLLEEQKKAFLNQPANVHDYEVKKNLIEQILKDAPEDREYSKEYTCICDYGEPCENCLSGVFNQSNSQWRELLNNLNSNQNT